MPYLPPIFYMLLSRYLSRNHLVTIPIPPCYHCITIQYFSRTILPAKCSATVRRVNILLLPRLVVECSIFSLSISPDSYSGISVMVLPLSVHAEYLCVPLGSLMLGDNPPSEKHKKMQFFLQFCKFCCTFATKNENILCPIHYLLK